MYATKADFVRSVAISQGSEPINPVLYAIKRRLSGGFNYKIFVFFELQKFQDV